MRPSLRFPLWLLSTLLAGLLAGWGGASLMMGREDKGVEVREGRHGFTNPLLDFETTEGRTGEILSFEAEMTRLIEDVRERGLVSRMSIYFRDLDNGPWFGVNESDPYILASLVKVPLAMACMVQTEMNPGFLVEKLHFFDSEYHMALKYPPPERLVPGESYTVENLLFRMTAYSDNDAANLLIARVDPRILDGVFTDLRLDPKATLIRAQPVSPRDFATFFRVLYNASYLDREKSEMLLSFLAQSEFREGIVGGIPRGILAAHKHGERGGGLGPTSSQLHDCGIVYHPSKPYLLCIMTQGADFDRLAEAIRIVSRFVWERVDEQVGKKAR